MKTFFVLALALFLLPQVIQAAPTGAEIIELINKERSSRGLPSLQMNSKLTEAAQGRAGVLSAEGRIYHTTAPAGQPWPEIKAVGYQYIWSGENLAVGYNTAEETVMRWMNSPSHRANILSSNYLDIGLGVAVGEYNGRQAPYVVAFFGQQSVTRATETRTVEKVAVQRKEPVAIATSSVSPKLPVARVSSGVISENLYLEGRILTELTRGLTSLLSVARANAST